jgi:hypothetical protein
LRLDDVSLLGDEAIVGVIGHDDDDDDDDAGVWC